jgi:KDO2-lipid IV(A) lauroyltransferase
MTSRVLRLKHIGEAALVLPFYYLFKILPFGTASFMIGKMMRFLGQFHHTHQTALKNLRLCFPEKTEEERKRIAFNAWENIGRIAGELPHITSSTDAKMQELVPLSGVENLEEAKAFAKKNGTGLIMLSAHVGNWEISSRMLLVLDPKLALIYRKANNPYVDGIIQKLRGRYTSFIVPKGDMGGMRDIIKHLKTGGSLGLLSDQKMNDGMKVNFFGTEVKAAAAAAEFSVKYNIPVVPFRTIRDEKTKINFVFRLEKPIYPEGCTSEQLMQKIYDIYEQWIREYPNQWFWQHNRFNLSNK